MMSTDDQDENAAAPEASDNWRPHPCPICSGMSVRTYRPFCSKRCADVDLGRWLKGRYSFEGGPARQIPDAE